MDLTPRGLGGLVSRMGVAAQNALEVARFGGLDTGEEPSPFEVVAETPIYRLRRYFPGQTAIRSEQPAPLILVPPMMLSADVYDVAPTASAVAQLRDLGIDPWVVDFGAPENQEGGLDRTLTDHVVAVADAVDRVREVTGRDVHLGGYSQGGMFCYQAAAFRRSDGITSLVTFGAPADTSGIIPFGIPQEMAGKVLATVADTVLAQGIPAWMSRTGFSLMDPVKSLQQRMQFVRQLHDRDALLPKERQRQFLMGQGWVAWPGPALADFMRQFVAHNRMMQGGFVIEDRLVTLADITCPMLCFVGEVDEIAPPAVVRAIERAAPQAEIFETSMGAGHFGLVVGSKAAAVTWPTVAQWIAWQDEGGARPDSVVPLQVDVPDGHTPSAADRLGHTVDLAVNVGAGMAKSVLGQMAETADGLRDLAENALDQLPRLNRLERVQPNTRISMGRLLDEQAHDHPADTFFLFEGRGYTYEEAKTRIDNIVRGLIEVGVRQGEHVGVLMDTRPTALATVAALNRVGAIVVMMRPEGTLAAEAELGEVTRVICDPERAGEAMVALEVPVLVLGGGGAPRELGFGLTDMERIDPDEVPLPGWYSPNPGRAQDLAFILFTGTGERVRINQITNRRWALSAFGTASAAALTNADTVYSVTPIHHPSGLLTSIGGAVAGGARLALATSFDPATFWEEVRRYGVTVVSYTWTMMREVADAPPHPAERHHPVRLFMGSGMPAGLWRRVSQRFAPARVLEFYASTEGGAVLVNLTGAKPGSKGRALPGAAEVRVVRYDAEAGRLIEGADGFAVECPPEEPGMLLARVDHVAGVMATSPLRGMFARNDAWIATGDLFRRDADGDHWLVDHAAAVIQTEAWPVGSVPIEDALGAISAVDLVAAYGVVDASSDGGSRVVPVAAVTLRTDQELDSGEVSDVVAARLPLASRPQVVHVIDEMPLTTWYRVDKRSLRAAGMPPRGQRWKLDSDTGRYRKK